MSIVGYDDIEVSRHVTPALTTVRQDTVLLGRLAADTIVHGIAGGGASREQILPVQLNRARFVQQGGVHVSKATHSAQR